MTMSEWNDALDAAAKLVGKTGFTWVRRHIDLKTMTAKIEVFPGRAKVKGDWDECTHCDGEDMAAAAILSLKRKERH